MPHARLTRLAWTPSSRATRPTRRAARSASQGRQGDPGPRLRLRRPRARRRQHRGHVFEAGSVSKQFTAAAVLLLAQRGKLELDDPCGTTCPRCPTTATPITCAICCTHTSGLRDWGRWRRRGLAARLAHAHARPRPGHRGAAEVAELPARLGVRYSNTGYNLARHHRGAGQRQDVRAVHADEDLRAAGHDPHPVARRLHAHRQGPRPWPTTSSRTAIHRTCRSRTSTATAGS